MEKENKIKKEQNNEKKHQMCCIMCEEVKILVRKEKALSQGGDILMVGTWLPLWEQSVKWVCGWTGMCVN